MSLLSLHGAVNIVNVTFLFAYQANHLVKPALQALEEVAHFSQDSGVVCSGGSGRVRRSGSLLSRGGAAIFLLGYTSDGMLPPI